ncbi:MAG: aminotransferase class V-fold PLP-dependent enzyme, partial [Candidatus Nanopelagicales bacterium]
MAHHFDAASGLPLTQPARRALDAALAHGWADPARLYRDGRVARQLLDAARSSIATSLGTLAQSVILTGSGTQAIHVGLLGLVRGRRKQGTRIVASAVEHSAVLRAADWALERGEPELIPVSPEGVVDVGAFSTALRSPGVAVAALQSVNHEVGALQPVEEVHAAAREAGVPLLVDACAGIGALPAPRAWDILVGSAHKWGGPAGVGVLVIGPGVRWRSP